MRYFSKAMLVASAAFCLNLSAYSQDISLKINNVTVKEAMERVKKDTGYSFVFSSKDVNTNQRVTVSVSDATIEEVIKQILKGQEGLDYEIQGKKIVLRKAQKVLSKENQDKKTVSGKVVDENGEPVIGATVLEVGTNNGVITDFDGNFSISLKNGANINVSYIGYNTQTINIINDKPLSIILKEDSELLDEVVVIGYGVQKKSDITGSVSSVKTSELLSAPTSSTVQALQGRVAGVVIQNTSGSPSGGSTIRIRGANSLTYGNDPLIIIDGVQDGNIGSLNPNEIESMEILKDAAALSVYGSKGANGVILVTTKKGKIGKPLFSYSGFVSFDNIRKTLPFLDSNEYATLVNEAQKENDLNVIFDEENMPLSENTTNWQDKIFRHSVSHSHNISLSGGKEGVSYFISGGYLDKQGIIQNTNYKQYSFRTNINLKASSRLNLTLNTALGYSKEHNGDYEQAIMASLQWAPTKTIYDSTSEGGYTQPGGGIGPVALYNPVGYALEIVNDKNSLWFNTSLSAEYKIFDWLSLSSLLSYKNNSNIEGFFDNQKINNGDVKDINGSKTQARYMFLQSTNIISFNKKIGNNNISATGVYEVLKDNYQSNTSSSRGIPVGMGYNGIHFGSILQNPWLEYASTMMQSYMLRVNYGYNNRYLLSGSIRYDGASQLSEGNKYDSFFAFSFGWNLMEEKFMADLKRIIPEFKIRVSYGSVGNAAVPAYSSHLKIYPGHNDDGDLTLSLSDLGNKNLKWERTNEFNIGIDSRWWNGKFVFSAEYYYKKTKDLLMWQKVPSALGVSSILSNVGSVSNKGIDLMFGGTPLAIKNFKWDINYTFNMNNNKILKLDGFSDVLITTGADYPGLVGSFVQMVGQPMGTFLGYTYAGVWKQSEISTAALYGAKPGDAKYVDINKDGRIDKDDIGIIGNAQPKYSFGFNNTFKIFDFDVNVFFQGVSGNDIYNQNRIRRETYSSDAFPTSPVIKEHWTPMNESDIPAFSGSEYINSSRWVEKGDYLRLKNISIGYSIPNKVLSKFGVTSARIYLSANNLLTLTSYSGFDPEASMGSDSDAAGVDRGVYPASKSFLIGLDFKF